MSTVNSNFFIILSFLSLVQVFHFSLDANGDRKNRFPARRQQRDVSITCVFNGQLLINNRSKVWNWQTCYMAKDNWLEERRSFSCWHWKSKVDEMNYKSKNILREWGQDCTSNNFLAASGSNFKLSSRRIWQHSSKFSAWDLSLSAL